METRNVSDNVAGASSGAHDQKGAEESESYPLWKCPLFTVPAAVWCVICTLGLWAVMPFLLALPLGCLLGVILFFLVGLLITSGSTSLLELCVGNVIAFILLALMVPIFGQAREKARRQSCADNIRALSQALTLYTQDNDGNLPLASNWEDAVYPFLPEKVGKTGRAVSLPLRCLSASPEVSYALYQPLAGSRLTRLTDAETTPLVFEADVPVGTLAQLPRPGRHRDGNMIGYADGHVRWQKMSIAPSSAPLLYARTSMSRKILGR